MGQNLVRYMLYTDTGEIKKISYPIVDEKVRGYSPINGDLKTYTYQGKNGLFSVKDYDINCIQETGFEQVFVSCVDDGTNTIANEKLVTKLLTNYINQKQKGNEERYYEQTIANNNCLHAIKNAFALPKDVDFIQHIKKQAIQCKELLSKCDCVEGIRALMNWGYGEDEIMVDVDYNGLVPLKQAINVNCLVDDYVICQIQLENFEDLGTVLYDIKENTMYFSVYDKEIDDEYPIIEDTTLDTLEEDYRAFLEKQEDKER